MHSNPYKSLFISRLGIQKNVNIYSINVFEPFTTHEIHQTEIGLFNVSPKEKVRINRHKLFIKVRQVNTEDFQKNFNG